MPDAQALDNAIEHLYITQSHKLTQVELDEKIEELRKSFSHDTQKPVVVTPMIKSDALFSAFYPDKTARDNEIEQVYMHTKNAVSLHEQQAKIDHIKLVYDTNDTWVARGIEAASDQALMINSQVQKIFSLVNQQLRNIGIVR